MASLNRSCQLLALHLILTAHAAAGMRYGLQQRRSLLVEPDLMVGYGQGSILPPHNTGSGSGCIVFPDLLPPGQALVDPEDNLQPSVEECCRSCREMEECNVFWYCGEQDGCTGYVPSSRNYTAPFQGCGLDFQSDSSQGVGQNVVALPAPGYIGGAPIQVNPPTVEGYDTYPGLSFFESYDYPCNTTLLNIVPNTCAERGNPKNLSHICDEDPRCRGFVWFEYGRANLGFPMIIFKGGEGVTELNLSRSYYNPNAALYVQQEPAALPAVPPDTGGDSSSSSTGSGGGGGGSSSSGGGISTGAVVGIVVGSVCALGLAAAGAVVLVKRRRQRLQEVQEGSGKDGSLREDGSLAAAAEQGSLSSHEPQQQQQQPGSRSPSLIAHSHGSSVAGVRRTQPPSTSSKGSQLSQAFFTVAPPSGVPRCPPMPWEAGSKSLAPLSSSSTEYVLSQLPDDDWISSVVDYNDIHFCENTDGSLVQLGSGAFSTVYRVMLSGVAPHAAKVLQLSGDPRQAEMFIKEVSMLRTLRHRNIICFAGVCVWEDKGIILMELAEGKSLHARLGSVNKQGERTMRWYGRGKVVALDVANALLYLHSHNVVHFDVKSGNVLLTRDGTAKLCDVGLSRALRHTHHSVSHGGTGTFDFMAPELLMGRQCNQSVDIYSFGILLWEICTGEYAVRGCMGGLSVPEQCPQAVADLFLECIDEDPAKRPSARELTARLMALQHASQRREEVC